MAEKRRFMDVWIVEGNTVYREVPFTVVGDWVQQGRLLENDMLRPSGTRDWFKLGSNPTFAAYLPRSEPHRAEDKAEALEPVQLDFDWKRRPEDEGEDDVDMIPLIDVSLVLLIFFMMIASVGAISGKEIRTSASANGDEIDPKTFWVGVQLKDGTPVYSMGDEGHTVTMNDGSLETSDRAVFLATLNKVVQDKSSIPVRIRAQEDVMCDTVMDMIAQVQLLRPHTGQILKDVRDKKG